MPVTHWTPSHSWAGSSLLVGLRSIANPLTGAFSEPTIVLLAKHHHMFLVPFPFLGLLALTGIGFSWCLLWLLATSCSYAWNREDSWREERGADAAGALPTYPQQALPADCHGPAPSSELRPLEAALTQELWLKTPALVPLEWGDCEACWSLTGSRRIESLWLPWNPVY